MSDKNFASLIFTTGFSCRANTGEGEVTKMQLRRTSCLVTSLANETFKLVSTKLRETFKKAVLLF